MIDDAVGELLKTCRTTHLVLMVLCATIAVFSLTLEPRPREDLVALDYLGSLSDGYEARVRSQLAEKHDARVTRLANNLIHRAASAITSFQRSRLSQSDVGEFVLRGQSVTINYFQGGRKGQGRIQIEATEIERLQNLMRVRLQPQLKRRQPNRLQHFPGITVTLGRPDHIV